MTDRKESTGFLTGNKYAIVSAIVVAIVSVIATSVIKDWRKLDDVVTQQMLDEALMEVVTSANTYTDSRVDDVMAYQEAAFRHNEELREAADEKYLLILKSIDDRLDRIDKRTANYGK